MIAAWLLALSTADPLFAEVLCPRAARLRSIDPATAAAPAGQSVRHLFQNGHAEPLRLFWVDREGRLVDQGEIAPGRYASLQTYPGHLFVLSGANERCRAVVRIDGVVSGTYLGTSRYRRADVPGWTVFVDRALDPARDPANAALTALDRGLREIEAALPSRALTVVRETPIFLHDRAGSGGMFHFDPDWLVAHGRTVELTDAVEISDATMFVDTLREAPSAVLHELAHAYHAKLTDAERGEIERVYRSAIASGKYLKVRHWDGKIGPAYASASAAEYFAETSEAWFGRNDFPPFTRDELLAYDPEGAALIARLWR